MPKSSKKKKDKAADFSKAKLKLGKGKQVANNATDTSFKARSIALPHQTIGLEKDASKATTRRNLTLDDLLIHLKHYSPTTRKDALWGLRELMDAHPHLIETSLTPVIQACARIVGDEDAEVRKALLAFLRWFLRLVPLSQLQPHTPLLILFITSAQTHIFPAIRVDAVRFLDLLLEFTPEAVIHGWNELESTGSRVLEGYLGLLNAGSGYWTAAHKDDVPAPSSSSVTLSPGSKLVVLSSLASFLRTAISPASSRHESAIPTWYIASSFSTYSEYQAFCSLIQPSHTASSELSSVEVDWTNNLQEMNTEDFIGNFHCAEGSTLDPGFTLGELGGITQAVEALVSSSAAASHSNSASSRIARLAHTLHPILIATWLDVAPTVFGVGASGDELAIQLGVSVGQIADCLYGAVFRDVNLPITARTGAFDDLTALLGYMSTYLPCVSENGDAQSEQLLHNLSFTYCELTSLVTLATQFEIGAASVKGSGPTKIKQSKALVTQIDRVGEYVVKALDGELKSTSHPLGYALTASSYTMLLPTIWSLLKYKRTSGDSTISTRVCTSTVNHALRTSSKSGAKRVATQFVGLLALLYSQPQASRNFYLVLTPNELERFKEWHLQLPKVLWEVGAGDPLLAETILRLLLRIIQRRSGLLDATTLASIRSRLIPYFVTVHPQKGELLGPFTKLMQPHLRRLVLDVAFIILQDMASPVDEHLKEAVNKAVNGMADADYWCTLVSSSRWTMPRGFGQGI